MRSKLRRTEAREVTVYRRAYNGNVDWNAPFLPESWYLHLQLQHHVNQPNVGEKSRVRNERASRSLYMHLLPLFFLRMWTCHKIILLVSVFPIGAGYFVIYSRRVGDSCATREQFRSAHMLPTSCQIWICIRWLQDDWGLQGLQDEACLTLLEASTQPKFTHLIDLKAFHGQGLVCHLCKRCWPSFALILAPAW